MTEIVAKALLIGCLCYPYSELGDFHGFFITRYTFILKPGLLDGNRLLFFSLYTYIVFTV